MLMLQLQFQYMILNYHFKDIMYKRLMS